MSTNLTNKELVCNFAMNKYLNMQTVNISIDYLSKAKIVFCTFFLQEYMNSHKKLNDSPEDDLLII